VLDADAEDVRRYPQKWAGMTSRMMAATAASSRGSMGRMWSSVMGISP
jgi:hypothetical protein